MGHMGYRPHGSCVTWVMCHMGHMGHMGHGSLWSDVRVFKPALLHQVDQSHVNERVVSHWRLHFRNHWTKRRSFAISHAPYYIYNNKTTARSATISCLFKTLQAVVQRSVRDCSSIRNIPTYWNDALPYVKNTLFFITVGYVSSTHTYYKLVWLESGLGLEGKLESIFLRTGSWDLRLAVWELRLELVT